MSTSTSTSIRPPTISTFPPTSHDVATLVEVGIGVSRDNHIYLSLMSRCPRNVTLIFDEVVIKNNYVAIVRTLVLMSFGHLHYFDLAYLVMLARGRQRHRDNIDVCPCSCPCLCLCPAGSALSNHSLLHSNLHLKSEMWINGINGIVLVRGGQIVFSGPNTNTNTIRVHQSL